MTIDQFWSIVGSVHVAGGGDMKRKCKLIGEELRKLSAEEARSFSDYYEDLFYRAYSYELWDAAALICGGCSDDSFMDFRHTLISMGREIYEKAMSNPDSLAELDLDSESASFEGYQYAVSHACEDVMRGEGKGESESHRQKHPKKPTGTRSKEWELEKRFPKLAAKYDHKDADHLWEKEKWERRNRKLNYTLMEGSRQMERQGSLAELLLDAQIIRDSGWIPPFRIIARILQDREFVEGEQRCFWDAFEWNEGDYWQAVSEVRRLPPQDVVQRRPMLRDKVLQQDIKTPPTDDYRLWVQSLKDRGLET
jgi:hypothetical protein